MAGPLESVRHSVATHNVVSPVGAEIVAEKNGTYRGEAVRTSQENSKLSQGHRDISLHVMAKMNLKTLQTRSLRQGQASNQVATSRIADYYDKLPNMPSADQLQGLVDTLQSMQSELVSGDEPGVHADEDETGTETGDAGEETGTGPDEREFSGQTSGGDARAKAKQQVLSHLQRFDGDVSHQFAALEIMRGHFEAEGADPDFMLVLDEARAEFEKTDVARDVRAGMAVAVVANEAAQTLETDPASVRNGYRAMLREQPNIGRLFDGLARFDLTRKFDAVIETFMVAAGRDLASTGPSSDPTFLHGLLTELSKLKKMRTVFEQGKDLIRTTERLMERKDRGRADPVDLTSRMLNFCAKTSVGINDAKLLLGPISEAAPQSQVVFANGLKTLHGEIPDEVMPSNQARLQQGTTLMSLLGQLVDAEEASYEAGA